MSARVIVITSGKGGVGKTTITANLGRQLASSGAEVALLDVDIGLNNLDVLTDIEHRVVFDIVDCIENRCRVRQALVQDSLESRMYILPSCHSYDKSIVSGQNIKAIVATLSISFDYVLIDCPAGIELGFHRAVAAANEALVVVTPHISSIRDADKVIKLLTGYKLDSTRLVINRARGDLMLDNTMATIDDIKGLLGIDIAGVIPEDDSINMLSNLGSHSRHSEQSKAAMAVLAQNVATLTSEIYDVTKRYMGLFGGLRRRIKNKV